MSANQPPLPPTNQPSQNPPPPIDAQQLLAFLGDENERHRTFFKEIFEKTAWVLGVLITAISAAGIFVGWNTINNAKQSAEGSARDAVQQRLTELRPQIDREVADGVGAEFKTPKIDEVVQQAARDATATTAHRVIRDEVRDQVALSVRTEQSEVSNTLQVAARNAVTRVQGNIQQSADRAVAKIVNDQIAPELKKLRAYSDLSSAVALARAGDGNGMDRLAQIAVDDQALPEIRRAARATIDSVAGLMTYGPAYAFGGDCKTGQPSAKPLQSVSFYVSLLSRRSTDDRYQGAFCLGRPADFLSAGQNEQSLRDAMEPLFRAMAEDPDLSVRKAAFSSFVHIGEWIYPKEPVAGEIRLFENAANAKWWSENRARFISRQSNH